MAISLEYINTMEGFAIYRGEHKVAILHTRQHQGVFVHGVAQIETMPASSWVIHWTSPQVSADLVKAVVASLPAGPGQIAPS